MANHYHPGPKCTEINNKQGRNDNVAVSSECTMFPT